MPMPVSDTSKATTAGEWLRTGCSALQPPTAAETRMRTPPSAVNLNAFDNRFFSTCYRRLESVTILRPRFGSTSMSNDNCRFSASCRNGRPTVSRRLEVRISSASNSSSMKRRLAAILAADIAGYSGLMGEDEAATVRDLKGHQAIVLPLVGQHGGRIIDTAGDGILAEFPSVVGATECAIEIQAVMAVRNADVPEPRRM